MTSEVKNIDDLIAQDMANQQAGVQPIQEVPSAIESAPSQEPAESASESSSEPAVEQEQPAEQPVSQSEPTESAETGNKPATESPIDEYGNPVEKPKLYTAEEVDRMMRDRLSRGKFADQPQHVQQQVKQDAKNFQADPNSEESWETQLEAFVERTIEKRQVKQSEQQWRENEAKKQAEFESKFTNGMNRYSDFHKVVEGKPITNDMLMATRALENPAAFVYGASKLHPQELERIARIADPYAQAAEVGRLHERMVKESKKASSAPKPLEAPKGSLPNKVVSKISLEDRINQYAKQKRK